MAINKRIISGEPAPEYGMAIVKYNGDGNSNRTIEGFGFQPDLVWILAHHNQQYVSADSNLGVTQAQLLNENYAAGNYTLNRLKSFTGDGIRVGNDGQVNGTGKTYTALAWKANSGTTSTGSGSGVSNVSYQINDDYGFGILDFTEAGASSSSINHEGSSQPRWIHSKRYGGTQDWMFQCSNPGGTRNGRLNKKNAFDTNINFWNNTTADSTKITLGRYQSETDSYGSTVCRRRIWHWATVPGYSEFGGYAGSGSQYHNNTDFEVKCLIIKRFGGEGNWNVYTPSTMTAQSYGYNGSTSIKINRDATNGSGTYNSGNVEFRDGSQGGQTRFQITGTGSEINQWSGNYTYAAWGGDSVNYVDLT
jgi:hypothetical protein